MGNRAVITTRENFENNGVGIYLHWNGGRDSVEAFLKYAQLRKLRPGSYGWARLCQIIANYFGGNLSIGIDKVRNLDCDNWDNGVYLIDDEFNIVGRRFGPSVEQHEYDLEKMLRRIDIAQPVADRIYHADGSLDEGKLARLAD